MNFAARYSPQTPGYSGKLLQIADGSINVARYSIATKQIFGQIVPDFVLVGRAVQPVNTSLHWGKPGGH